MLCWLLNDSESILHLTRNWYKYVSKSWLLWLLYFKGKTLTSSGKTKHMPDGMINTTPPPPKYHFIKYSITISNFIRFVSLGYRVNDAKAAKLADLKHFFCLCLDINQLINILKAWGKYSEGDSVNKWPLDKKKVNFSIKAKQSIHNHMLTLHLNCDAWEAELWAQQVSYISEDGLCISFFLWGHKTKLSISRVPGKRQREASVLDVRRPTCSHMHGQQSVRHVKAPHVQTVNIRYSTDSQQLRSHAVHTDVPRSSCTERTFSPTNTS